MIVFRALHEHEIEKWLDFISSEIFTKVPREYFANQWYTDPDREAAGVFAAFDEHGDILSSLRVFRRSIYIGGETVLGGGIGSVGTKAEYRGQGLCSRLFELCTEYMLNSGICYSWLLCGEHNEGFYNRFAYHKIPFQRNIAEVGEGKSLPQGLSVRRAVFPEDIEYLAQMHAQFSGSMNGSVVRGRAYWEQWVPTFKHGSYHLVEDAAQLPIAYANIENELDGKQIFIFDYGYMAGNSAVFDALISATALAHGRDDLQVVYQSVIASDLPVTGQREMCCVMVKLISPFSIGNILVSTAAELLAVFHGEGAESKFLLWEIDDI